MLAIKSLLTSLCQREAKLTPLWQRGGRGDLKKNFFTYVLLCILFISLIIPFSSGAEQKSFIWKVRSKTGTVYLVGSLHVFKKSLYPLPKKIEEAFGESEVLAVEAKVDEINPEGLQKMLERAFYPDNETLEKHISKETFALTRSKLKELGVSIELFQRNKPWLIAMMLTTLELRKLGFDPAYGIDNYFLGKAKDTKRISELESADYQIDLLNTFSDNDQELFLLYTLKDLDTIEGEMNTLIEAWKSGDTKTMESVLAKGLAEDPGIARIYEKLFYERNKNMASKIDGFLKTGEKYFVIMGAGHLVGKKGVLELLRERGYPVEQL